jgi:hypothetical protein
MMHCTASTHINLDLETTSNARVQLEILVPERSDGMERVNAA